MDYRLEQLRFELREDPSSRIFFKLGEHLRREGELDEAIEVLKTGLQQHTRYVAAWVSLGRAQLENGDAVGAQESLDRALQLDPENSVAARAMGEAAIVNGDWVTAVKALKRARGLAPRDEALEERIVFVEARLAELGQLEKPPPAEGVRAQGPVAVPEEEAPEEPADQPPGEAADDPFAVRRGDTGEWTDADDVFAAGWVAEGGETTAEDAKPAVEPTQDTEAYAGPAPLTEDDVAAIVGVSESKGTAEPAVVIHDEEPPEVEAMPEPEPGPAIVPEPVPEREPESVPEPVVEPGPAIAPEPIPEPEPVPEPATEFEVVSGPAVEPEPLPESWPDPDSEPELERDADGVPLPTMTLARLAIGQGDLDLAERTLRGVLEREPGHTEAEELLETLLAGPPDQDSATSSAEGADDRAEALRRWLDAVRLASERLKT